MGLPLMSDTATHESVTDDEQGVLIQNLLDKYDTTLEELRQQADEGRFSTDGHRRAWFLIDGLGPLGEFSTRVC